MNVSIIIPVLNGRHQLPATLASLKEYDGDIEVLVVDGGSLDGTLQFTEQQPGIQLLHSTAGRARQMNVGARKAQGNILIFLHADTQLASGWLPSVVNAMQDKSCALGAFKLGLDAPEKPYRILEKIVNLRSRFVKLPYGDQAMFIRKSDFEKLGGFPDQPLMEDVELVRRARTLGSLKLLPLTARTSAEKWQQDGIVARTIRNWKTFLFYTFRRKTAAQLVNFYEHHRRAIIVFCKFPKAGRVKTRLAATIGDEEAIRIYKNMVEHTLREAKACPMTSELLIFFDPPETRDALQTWLGEDAVYLPQCKGDLGARMLDAFQTAKARGCNQAIIIGTDCPGLTQQQLQQSFSALNRHETVIGPTFDGGYYLIAAREPQPFLFEDMPWSTEAVLPETLKRLEKHSNRYALLEKLRDVDHEEDLAHYPDF